MKTNTLKTIAIATAFCFVSAFAALATEIDSIIVQFGGSSKMVINTKDKAAMMKLKSYDFNKIVRDLTAELDSNNKEAYVIINEKNGSKYRRDTVFTFKTSVDTTDTKTNGDVSVSFKDGRIIVVDKDGRRRSISISGKGGKGGKGGHNGKDGEDGKDGSINNNDNRKPSDGQDGEDGQSDRDGKDGEDGEESDISIKLPKDRTVKSPRKGFNMSLGVNVYGQNEALKYNTADYDLRAGSSRYFSMGWTRSATIAKGQNSSAFLDLGLEFSWYNLMFDGNNTARKDANGNVTFPSLLIDGRAADLSKSKLTAPYVNVSIMPTVAFRGALQYISAGMYAGYRIGGYTKTKLASSGQKERIKSNLGLSDFRYGIGAEVGLRGLPDLFFNYDINELFQAGHGPAVRMVSFGIRM